MKRLVCGFLIICMTGCSTTVINSVPSNANLYLNDEKVGTTPYEYTDGKVFWTSTSVTLKKDGYEDATYSMRKSEDVRWWIIPVSLLGAFIPLMWLMGYKPTHTYEMTPQKTANN